MVDHPVVGLAATALDEVGPDLGLGCAPRRPFLARRAPLGLQVADHVARDERILQPENPLRLAIGFAEPAIVAHEVSAAVAFDPAFRFYLDEEPILQNVETYLLDDAAQRDHVLQHLDQLVVKAVGESGGYGMLIGPHSTADQRAQFRDRILANPRNYIAQPTLELSTVPSLSEGELYPCHVDLRPYVLRG